MDCSEQVERLALIHCSRRQEMERQPHMSFGNARSDGHRGIDNARRLAVVKMRRGKPLPAGVVRVDRNTKWGNPFRIGRHGTRREVIEKYREYIKGRLDLIGSLGDIRGMTKACWCHDWDGAAPNPMYCHADILHEMSDGLRSNIEHEQSTQSRLFT